MLLVTLVAFEYVGVATALPSMVVDLRADRLYSWPIILFTSASAIGAAVGGRICDRIGPKWPLLAGITVFGLGLLVAATADAMSMLLAGRVVQGIGAGVQTVALSVMVAMVYPARDRPAASAVFAAAWVVPALLGPSAAGLVTEHFGWRWVFGGLLPLVAIGAAMLAPALHLLPQHTVSEERARPGLVPASLAVATGLIALSWAGQNLSGRMPAAAYAAVGLGGLLFATVGLRRLLPAGTATGRPGLPAVVLCRALIAGAYNTVDVYLPLALTVVHHATPAFAGLPLTAGALGWSATSLWQGRYPDISRTLLLRVGMCLVGIAAAGMALIALPGLPGWLAFPLWVIGGAGMGLGFPSIAVLQLAHSTPANRGFASSATQLSEMVGTVVLVGVGGMLVNAVASATHPAGGLILLDLLVGAGALAAARFVAGRTAVRR